MSDAIDAFKKEVAILTDECLSYEKQIAALKAENTVSKKQRDRLHEKVEVAEAELSAANYTMLEKENRRLERDLNLMAQGNFPEHESLKLDIWVEHMASETLLCPPGIRELICRPGMLHMAISGSKADEKYCVPCWRKFTEEKP